MLNLKEYRSAAKGLPDLLNLAFIVGSPNVHGQPMAVGLTKSGTLIGGFSYAGPDLESSSPGDLEVLSAQINHALNRLGSGWACWIDMIRESTVDYPSVDECCFTEPVSMLIDDERRGQHEREGSHFISRYAIVFGFTLPSDAESKLVKAVISNSSQRTDGLNEHISRFATEIESIVSVFRGSSRVTVMSSSELLTHIHGAITGDYHKIGVPRIPAFLDSVIGAHDLVGGFEPKIDGNAIRIVNFGGWPHETRPEILESLSNLPFPMRYNIRFLFLDPTESQKMLTVHRRNWFQKRHGIGSQISQAMGGEGSSFVNTDAIQMAADADAAIAEASSGVVRYGLMTANVVIITQDAKTANDRVRQVRQHIDNLGFVTRVETVNALEAWLGTIPGQTYENVRRPLMNSLNLADIMTTTSIWAGSARNPNPFQRDPETGEFAPPLLYGATSGNTPFRFSLHVGDVGHSLIAGPTGAGKSTLLALIAAQHLRYAGSRVFSFDKGMSMFALTRATGGAHYEPGADTSSLHFAPLCRVTEGPAERAWAEGYIEELCVMHNVPIDAARRKRIHEAIESLAASDGDKSITNFTNIVQDEEVRAALSFYTMTGRAGMLLDATSDSLDLDSRFTTFELDHLLQAGEASKLISVPVLLYLFHRIERSLTGAPSLILLDEAWVMLDHPIFSAKIREWLKTLRKANAAVVFATQSLADLRNSPLRPVILESCPTKILLPNREAMGDQIRPLYHDLGLNDWQIRLLQTAIPKSDYYIVTPDGRRRITLALGPVALAFAGVSDKESIAIIRDMINRFGDRWPIEWMRRVLPYDRHDWISYAETVFSEFDAARKKMGGNP
ncbi:conjugal transfer protein TrbE [Acidiphilium sp. PM]|uniref:TraG/VirB4 family ATPase n=1 Tax=Acidiphilium sp. PM TaxID=1043206 RepID=UPI000586BD51|nr:conjugal transfer protein TrbE [Acidiphilium sp. PM]